MGQITFYLDDALEQQMQTMIAQQQLSPQLWLADAIQRKLNNGWSADVMKLAGSWADFPETEALRTELEQDIPREPL